MEYANTRRLLPHPTQVKPSSANARLSIPAQSKRGVRSFRSSSTIAATDGLSSSRPSSALT